MEGSWLGGSILTLVAIVVDISSLRKYGGVGVFQTAATTSVRAIELAPVFPGCCIVDPIVLALVSLESPM